MNRRLPNRLHRRRTLRAGAYATLLLLLPLGGVRSAQAACPTPFGPAWIFEDGFELGSLCLWDAPADCPQNAAIASVRAAPDGASAIQLDRVIVTAKLPAIGGDPAGFFLQAEPGGPAIFVAVDPALLAPVPAVGDVVSLRATAVGTSLGLREVLSLDNWSLQSHLDGVDLARDLSAATDLVSNLDAYDSEMSRLDATITGSFGAAGTGFESALIATVGIPADSNLRLRLPSTLRSTLDLEPSCQLALCGSPLWRANGVAQPSIWNAAEAVVSACPQPTVVSAQAASATSVVVAFSRQIDPASVASDGSQFLFDNGLVATAAVASGKGVTLTTTAQANLVYSVTVSNSVKDLLGAGVGNPNSAPFSGFVQPANLLITEVNANIANGCDLVELRVVSSGSAAGFTLDERITTVLTAPAMELSAGDLVVVHFNSANTVSCNPGTSSSETSAKNQYPSATYGRNYDNAWDWYVTDTGLTATDNVLTLFDAQSEIADAVLLANLATGTAAADSETAAAGVALAGEWTMVGGGVPAGGFVDDDFRAHAVLDLDGTDSTTGGTTIQRAGVADTNSKADWSMTTATWGAANAAPAPNGRE